MQTAEGPGRVVEVNLIRQTVKVLLKSEPDAPAKQFAVADITVTRRGKGDRKQEQKSGDQ